MVLIFAPYSTRPATNTSPKPEPPNSPTPLKYIGVALLTIVIIIMAGRPFIEFDVDGEPILALWRKQKLQKELVELEEAEQYVLIAETPGLYPCHSCTNTNSIYLMPGQVWKYGMTTKGKEGRYGNSLSGMKLHYIVQFTGTIEQCLQEEKRKIYNYALLPENLARAKPLIRPPGNKQDS